MEEAIPEETEPIVFADGFCPLCSSKRTRFTCENCIRIGLFYNSRKRSEESYEEKRQRLETITKLKSDYAERVLQYITPAESVEELRHNIQLHRNKVTVLRECVSFLRKEEARDRTILSKTTEENKKRRSRLEKLKERIKTREKETSIQNSEFKKKLAVLNNELENVTQIRRVRIDQIKKYLFPISKQKVFPEFGTPPDDTVVQTEACDVIVEAGESCEMALTEATRTSYIEGRWVSDDDLGNIQYGILETFLPADGDYSAYSQLLKANKNGSNQSVPTCNLKNSAFSLTAGLGYTCQLLDLMAFFLDVTLPKDLNYSEFCLRELSASEFKSAVSRLNANVMYLCLSQKISSQLLHPKRTLQNIHACLQSSNVHLGRCGAHNVFDHIGTSGEDNDDYVSSSEDESELGPVLEASSSDNEWETILDAQVPTILPDETTDSSRTRRASANSEQQSRRTTTSSLVSSVTSLWPWKS